MRNPLEMRTLPADNKWIKRGVKHLIRVRGYPSMLPEGTPEGVDPAPQFTYRMPDEDRLESSRLYRHWFTITDTYMEEEGRRE